MSLPLAATSDRLRVGSRELDPRLILAAAVVVAGAVDLWLGHGTTFSTDELGWFSSTPGLDVHHALLPPTTGTSSWSAGSYTTRCSTRSASATSRFACWAC